ncbi:hypothetical protein Igni_1151 [Ignicoccus hospitalis KIN4/I]|uniref:CRISPR-associated protein Cas6 C-terminal domain-containing protein n=2 Tax=Ignicoccus TaxID=54258 RepID=A8ABM6_IGNH4|nr:hypothetical protein Igni_1151 [Ignicoccus hospitalis KIN4/I]
MFKLRVYLETSGGELFEYSGLLTKLIAEEIASNILHVSPLYSIDGKTIYPKVMVDCSFCKVEAPKSLLPVKLPEKGYFEMTVLNFPKTITSEVKVILGNKVYEIRIEGVEEIITDVGYGSKLIIKFNGPVIIKKGKAPFNLRFLPLPSYLFSPYVSNPKALLKLDEIFVEDHSILHSVGKVWYLYRGKWRPGLTGVALFHVVEELPGWVLEILRKGALLGVGFRRREGFGNVTLELFD